MDAVTRVTKVLAVTGYLDENARQRILEVGADAFLEKPSTIAVFQAEVARLLGEDR